MATASASDLDIRRRARDELKLRGISYATVAKAAGVSWGFVFKVMHGKRRSAKIDAVVYRLLVATPVLPPGARTNGGPSEALRKLLADPKQLARLSSKAARTAAKTTTTRRKAAP